jgi:hypothetical protein
MMTWNEVVLLLLRLNQIQSIETESGIDQPDMFGKMRKFLVYNIVRETFADNQIYQRFSNRVAVDPNSFPKPHSHPFLNDFAVYGLYWLAPPPDPDSEEAELRRRYVAYQLRFPNGPLPDEFEQVCAKIPMIRIEFYDSWRRNYNVIYIYYISDNAYLIYNELRNNNRERGAVRLVTWEKLVEIIMWIGSIDSIKVIPEINRSRVNRDVQVFDVYNKVEDSHNPVYDRFYNSKHFRSVIDLQTSYRARENAKTYAPESAYYTQSKQKWNEYLNNPIVVQMGKDRRGNKSHSNLPPLQIDQEPEFDMDEQIRIFGESPSPVQKHEQKESTIVPDTQFSRSQGREWEQKEDRAEFVWGNEFSALPLSPKISLNPGGNIAKFQGDEFDIGDHEESDHGENLQFVWDNEFSDLSLSPKISSNSGGNIAKFQGDE